MGERHPATLAALVQLGLVMLEKKQLDEAEELLQQALVANRETFGDGHPQTLASITWLAGLYEAKGQVDQALPLHQEVLRGFAAASHPMTQRCAGHVVALMRQQGSDSKAVALSAEYGVPVGAPEAAPLAPPAAGDGIVAAAEEPVQLEA